MIYFPLLTVDDESKTRVESFRDIYANKSNNISVPELIEMFSNSYDEAGLEFSVGILEVLEGVAAKMKTKVKSQPIFIDDTLSIKMRLLLF